MKTNPKLERLIVFERGTEPFSGLPMLWIGALLPDIPFDPAARVEAYFDGVLKSWLPLRRLEPSDDTPDPGSGFDLQIIDEPDVKLVHVILRSADSTEKLAERRMDEVHRRLAHGVTEPPPPPATRSGRFKLLARRAVRKIAGGEVLQPRKWGQWSKRVARKVIRRVPPPAPTVDDQLFRDRGRSLYAAHCANNDLSPRRRDVYAAEAAAFAYRPTISVLMPVYNVEVRWLRAAIDSVRDQVYDTWELCLADDASPNPLLRSYLQSLDGDPRISVAFRSENGHICRATNSAAELATGDFVAFMDNDDALAPDALFHYVRHLNEHPETDILYSDEDKIDASDRRYDPQFKPDWSPELLLSYNYVNHFTCMRRVLFERAGRLRPGFEGGQDYDLLLRATEFTDRVHHVPRVLYHWRSLPTSTAAVAAVKPVMFTSCERGLRERLSRSNSQAEPYTPPFAERLRLPISLLDFPNDGPSVAIIVPHLASPTSHNRRVAIDVATYQTMNWIDAEIAPNETWSAAINRVAAERTEEFLLVLDPSLTPADPRWLSRLMAYAQLPGVGCVGPRVLDPDGRIVHAGLVMGMHDETAPGRAFAGHAADDVSYYFLAEVARNVSALAGDCFLTRRATFIDNGGLDAGRFPETLAVADYCRRLAQCGLRTVCVGGVDLVRPDITAERDDPLEVRHLHERHGRGSDAFANPNFSHRHSFQIVPACPHAPAIAAGARARVLFAAHNLSATEGAPRYLFDIAAGLKSRGRVEPIVFSPMPGAGAEWYRRHEIPVHVGHLPHARNFLEAKWQPAEYAQTIGQLSALLDRLCPDVVVCNTLGNFPMVEAAARAGIPSVWIIHESYTDAQMTALHSPFALFRVRAAFALTDRALIASHATARLFAAHDKRHTIEVIHNGLEAAAIEEYLARTTPAEAKRLLAEPPGRKRLTAVGTVCERKGQYTLVEAATRLRRAGRDDFLVALVGVRDTSLSYVNYIRALIDREGLHDFIALIPETNDVRPYWRASDVFVCASHVEAFSRSMLEAEAFGLPIVSTPCCGADEQVVWGRNAFRFDFSDSRQLADHLEILLADDALRLRMGAASRAVYECHLTNNDMLDRYERLILNVMLHAEAVLPVALSQAA
jgi:glycosyltransferase involved in cell wall biosynthesis/GT2 family glycosyltransferase